PFPLHAVRRPGLQDRILIITDQRAVVANAGPLFPRQIRHRTRSRCWRYEPRKISVTPYASEIRDGHGALPIFAGAAAGAICCLEAGVTTAANVTSKSKCHCTF